MAMTGGVARLVSSGTPSGWPGAIKLYVYTKEKSQDMAGNTTTLSLGMYVETPSNYAIGAWTDFNGSYVGTATSGANCKTFSGDIPQFRGTRWLVENQEIVVPHNEDGTKSVTIYWKWGVNSAWSGVMNNPSGSFSLTLTKIPRASTIGATDADIESVSSIVVTKGVSSYMHSVKYQFGKLTGYIKADGTISDTEVKISATSIAFTLPTDFYNQIPNAQSGSCTLTCTTYSGNSQVGSATTAKFQARASRAKCAPTLNGIVVDINQKTIGLTGNKNVLVWYMSNAECTITAYAKNGATIVSKKISGVAVDGNIRIIEAVDTGRFVFEVTDSRGYTTNGIVTKTIVSYVKLTANAIVARTSPTSGDATLNITGDFYSGTFGSGGVQNTLTAKYRVRKSGGTYGSYVSVTPTKLTNKYEITATLSGLDYRYAHDIEIVIADKLATVTKVISVKKGIPLADWGKDNFRFNEIFRLASGLLNGFGDSEPTERLLGGRLFFQKVFGCYVPRIFSAGVWSKLYPDSGWINLGLSGNVSLPASGSLFGNYTGCGYRIINGFVCVSANVKFTYNGSIVVNANKIPTEYCPPNNLYLDACCNGVYRAKVGVYANGNIAVEYLINTETGSRATSISVSWCNIEFMYPLKVT